jgi:hypothetical protein
MRKKVTIVHKVRRFENFRHVAVLDFSCCGNCFLSSASDERFDLKFAAAFHGSSGSAGVGG